MYILQLDHKAPGAWQFCIRWPGYWAGIGYVENKKDAVRFPTKRDASRAAMGTFVGLNGYMKVVRI